MVKGLMIYTLLLTITDLLINLVINMVQSNPGAVILMSVVLRVICLFILFPSISLVLSYFVFNGKGNIKATIIITSLIVYLLIPLIVYLLKSNNKDLLTVFLDLHLKFNLFSLIFLPYIIASIITFYISNKFELF
jgi:hypothetical protein